MEGNLTFRSIAIKIKKEIDVILEENGKVYPIEIKKETNPDKKDIKNFDTLKSWASSGRWGCYLFNSNLSPTDRKYKYYACFLSLILRELKYIYHCDFQKIQKIIDFLNLMY